MNLPHLFAYSSYLLDQQGNRRQTTDATGVWTKYDYDSRGLLLRSQTAANVVHTYAYDAQGRKISDKDGLNNTNTWVYDYFGRLTDHHDLGAADYDYVYDASSGLLTQATSSRRIYTPLPSNPYLPDINDEPDQMYGTNLIQQLFDRRTEYYANGQVRRITDGDIYYYYEYDAAGNRTLEETKTVDGQSKLVHTITRTTYDSNNRISRVTTQDMTAGGAYIADLTYDYDAVGNRRRVIANSTYGANASSLTVGNRAPLAVGQPANQSVKAGAVVEWALDASATFVDPDGTPFSYALTLANGDPVPGWLHMSWDAATGQLRFRTDAGSATALGQTFSLRLTATDSPAVGTPMAVSVDFTLSMVANSAPVVATPIPGQSAPANGFAWSYTVPEDTFSDANGDALTYTASGLPAWMTFDAFTRTFSGIPSTVGSWTVTVTARDPSGAAASTTFTVTTANVGPTVASPVPDQTVESGEAWSYTLPPDTFLDRNGQALTYSVGNKPAWMSFNATTRTFSGTAPASGSWAITLTASDGSLSASDTFTVAVGSSSNQPPVVVTPIPDQTAPATGGSWSYTFPAGSFSDPEGGALTYSATGLPAWLTFDAATRKFTGTPAAVGSWTITVTAQDAAGATVSDTFAITTANVAPTVANPVPDQAATAGQTWSYVVPPTTFQDRNGQALTYGASGMPGWMTFDANTRTFSGTAPASGSWAVTVTASDGSLSASDTFTVTATAASNQPPVVVTPIPDQTAPATGGSWSYTFPAGSFSDPEGGALTYSATGLPAWLTFDAAARKFTGTPATVGSWTITVTAQDAAGATVSDTFAVTTPNAAPILANPIPSQTATAGQAWSYLLPANAFQDANQDALAYSATGLPAWMSFDATTRTFSGTPPYAASVQLQVQVSDGRGGSATGSFTLTIEEPANWAPQVAAPIPDQQVSLSQGPWSYTVPPGTFHDVEGDALTYGASGMPAWMTFNAATGTFTGTPPGPGQWTLTVTATDTAGGSVSSSFQLYVLNDPPVIVDDIPDLTASVGQPFSYTFTAFSDANGDPLTYTLVGTKPSWLTFDGATRTLSGNPTVSGTYTLKVQASDGSAVTNDSFTLTVVNPTNSAPVLNLPLEDQIGATLNYTFPADTFIDPDGDTLTYSYTVSPRNDHIVFNASLRKFSGTVSGSAVYTVTVTAKDGKGHQTSASFQVARNPIRAGRWRGAACDGAERADSSPTFRQFLDERHLAIRILDYEAAAQEVAQDVADHFTAGAYAVCDFLLGEDVRYAADAAVFHRLFFQQGSDALVHAVHHQAPVLAGQVAHQSDQFVHEVV